MAATCNRGHTHLNAAAADDCDAGDIHSIEKPEITRLKRHVSTLCALLSGVAVNAVLDTRSREIRDTIKQELGEA